jgi:hypothetical protein
MNSSGKYTRTRSTLLTNTLERISLVRPNYGGVVPPTTAGFGLRQQESMMFPKSQ